MNYILLIEVREAEKETWRAFVFDTEGGAFAEAGLRGLTEDQFMVVSANEVAEVMTEIYSEA